MSSRLRLLGTAGSQPLPLSGCDGWLCRAGADGKPDARRGYSLSVPAVETIGRHARTDRRQSRPPGCRRCLLTYWHPDHAGEIGRCRYDCSVTDRERRFERRADYTADTRLFDTDRLPSVDTLVFECGWLSRGSDAHTTGRQCGSASETTASNPRHFPPVSPPSVAGVVRLSSARRWSLSTRNPPVSSRPSSSRCG